MIIFGQNVQFIGKSPVLWDTDEYFNRTIFYMRTYLLLRLQFMLIDTYMDLFNCIYVINYTKFEHFGPKYPFSGEKSSFMGKKVEFFNRIIFYMRTYFLFRLQFMLINTYMDLFNWIYVVNYTKLLAKMSSLWGKVQFYG